MNTNIHNEDQQATPNINFKDWRVEAIIVSAQFWPQFKTETLELPENITKGLEAYTKAFEAVKGNRTLVWKPHLGNTNIDLEIGDKKINLTVSPIHAAIIYQFQVKVSVFFFSINYTYLLSLTNSYTRKSLINEHARLN